MKLSAVPPCRLPVAEKTRLELRSEKVHNPNRETETSPADQFGHDLAESLGGAEKLTLSPRCYGVISQTRPHDLAGSAG
jgi:hypothetical protein